MATDMELVDRIEELASALHTAAAACEAGASVAPIAIIAWKGAVTAARNVVAFHRRQDNAQMILQSIDNRLSGLWFDPMGDLESDLRRVMRGDDWCGDHWFSEEKEG